jgi:hypothetical protein
MWKIKLNSFEEYHATLDEAYKSRLFGVRIRGLSLENFKYFVEEKRGEDGITWFSAAQVSHIEVYAGRKLYLLSKPMPQPRLLGVLTELHDKADDELIGYQFMYKLGGRLPDKLTQYLSPIEFPNIIKTYIGEEVRPFIERVIPLKNDPYIDSFLKNAGITEYKEWELLKYCGEKLYEDESSLAETIPEGVVIYENLED